MAGAFSGHLLEGFETAQRGLKGPFGQPLQTTSNISVHGSMSFAPQMHGAVPGQSSFFQDTTLVDLSDESAKKIATLQAKLNRKLGPEYISQRPGPGGGPKLTYAEGWKIINLANEVFGFNGWSSSVINLTTDFIDQNEQSQRYSVGVTAVVRITLRDGAFHEDVGYGLLENSKSKGAALDKCKKEAVTDAVKRALRNFGNLLGNCLYDKSYTQEVVKMKVPPPKFNKDELHRRPEFEDTKGPAGVSTNTNATASSKPGPSTNKPAPPVVKTEATSRMEAILSACNASAQPAPGVAPALPPHMRSASGQAGPVATSTPNMKGKSSAGPDAGEASLDTPSDVATSRVGPSGQNQKPQYRPQETSAAHTTGAAQARNQQSDQRDQGPPQGGQRVSFAPPPIANTSSTVAVPPPAPAGDGDDADIPDDTSEFHFNSDDDAFLAEVDLGEEGIGGPINFDEGVGGLEVGEDSRDVEHNSRRTEHFPPQERAHPPQPQRSSEPPAAKPLQPYHAVSGSSSTTHRYQGTNTGNPTTHQTSKDASSAFAQSPPTMGGFHVPVASTSHPSNPQHSAHAARPNYTSSAGGSSIGFKRTADVMQGNSGAAAASRRPMQGMGLAPPPGPGTRQGAGGQRREPLAALDFGDGGDMKRMRR